MLDMEAASSGGVGWGGRAGDGTWRGSANRHGGRIWRSASSIRYVALLQASRLGGQWVPLEVSGPIPAADPLASAETVHAMLNLDQSLSSSAICARDWQQ